jgi:hypothetical protein
MPTPQPTAEQMTEIQALAARWGEVVARRMYGPTGPGLDVDFATMEQIALAAARGLTEGTLTALLNQQTQQLPTTTPCPDCKRECPVTIEPRPVQGRSATITYREPVAHCPDCRRDFFPPADDFANRRA